MRFVPWCLERWFRRVILREQIISDAWITQYYDILNQLIKRTTH
jgi:hypothetical protein